MCAAKFILSRAYTGAILAPCKIVESKTLQWRQESWFVTYCAGRIVKWCARGAVLLANLAKGKKYGGWHNGLA